MNDSKKKIEFGDFQTPLNLAMQVCVKLKKLGINPTNIVEPTCGVGAFLLSSLETFENAKHVYGYEINKSYLAKLNKLVNNNAGCDKVEVKQGDFFAVDWRRELGHLTDNLLVIGNFPWVTNSGIGAIGGANLPEKTNFLKQTGFDSISGKANFDISEWMLLEVMSWFRNRNGSIAMLVKTAVARKVLAHAESQNANVVSSYIFKVDAKKEFNASVDACLLVMIFDAQAHTHVFDYEVFESLDAKTSHVVGHRNGHTISDLTSYSNYIYMLGSSPIKWRSGIKHDCSSVMELARTNGSYQNGYGELVNIEDTYLYPLLKGSDIGSEKEWREKFVLVTQMKVGEVTDKISSVAPKTWRYLNDNSELLDARKSSIYVKNPQFSIFGVGDYAFYKWKIAICSLYKKLVFRLVAPIENKPVMFDDTVYYVSFETKDEAELAYAKITSEESTMFLKSLIFFDEKRPIKTGILNVFDWTKVKSS